MSHFAKIDKDNVVTQVIVAEQEHIDNIKLVSEAVDAKDAVLDPEGEVIYPAVEAKEAVYDNWVQTSYTASIRKNYAGIGYTYDEDKDAFIPPKPFASWTLDEDSCQWEAPVAYPDDDKHYSWDEDSQAWVEVTK